MKDVRYDSKEKRILRDIEWSLRSPDYVDKIMMSNKGKLLSSTKYNPTQGHMTYEIPINRANKDELALALLDKNNQDRKKFLGFLRYPKIEVQNLDEEKAKGREHLLKSLGIHKEAKYGLSTGWKYKKELAGIGIAAGGAAYVASDKGKSDIARVVGIKGKHVYKQAAFIPVPEHWAATKGARQLDRMFKAVGRKLQKLDENRRDLSVIAAFKDKAKVSTESIARAQQVLFKKEDKLNTIYRTLKNARKLQEPSRLLSRN